MKSPALFAEPSRVPSELFLDRHWDVRRIRELIAKKSRQGSRPAFLFLGQKESALLRNHLGQAFGEDSVTSLKDLYYLNLKVIELKTASFFRTAGRKRMENFTVSTGRRPRWKDVRQDSFWGLKF